MNIHIRLKDALTLFLGGGGALRNWLFSINKIMVGDWIYLVIQENLVLQIDDKKF